MNVLWRDVLLTQILHVLVSGLAASIAFPIPVILVRLEQVPLAAVKSVFMGNSRSVSTYNYAFVSLHSSKDDVAGSNDLLLFQILLSAIKVIELLEGVSNDP